MSKIDLEALTRPVDIEPLEMAQYLKQAFGKYMEERAANRVFDIDDVILGMAAFSAEILYLLQQLKEKCEGRPLSTAERDYLKNLFIELTQDAIKQIPEKSDD